MLRNFGPEIIYDHSIMILTMFEMLKEASVKVRLNASAIKTVTCYDSNGAFSLKPKIVIVCSCDGDISAKAGVSYVLGEESGNMRAVTISFHMTRVDWDVAFANTDLNFSEYAAKGIAEGRLRPNLANSK
jgi:hypothetical protein